MRAPRRPRRLSSDAPGVLAVRAAQDDDCDNISCCPDNEAGTRRRCYCCGLGWGMLFILLFAMSWDTLEPTEYGLVQNGFTGYVDLRPESVYEGGRYFVWLVRALPAIASPSAPQKILALS